MSPLKTESRRRDILQTAFECFTQFGYSKTSFDLIAQKTGISRPLIYQHFKNKEDLFACMLEDRFEERYQLAQQCLSSELSPPEKLAQFVEILILKDWPALSGSFHGVELFSQLYQVLPKFEAKYKKKFIQLVTAVLGNEELAEVFRFSLTGLQSDNPSVGILRKRAKLLIQCICLSVLNTTPP